MIRREVYEKIALVLSLMMVAGESVACSSNTADKAQANVQSSNVEAAEYIGEEKAKEIMLEKVAGAQIVEFELDEDDDDGDDIIEYEAELQKDGVKYDISVDAITGKIIDFEQDDMDDDKDDVDDVSDKDDNN